MRLFFGDGERMAPVEERPFRACPEGLSNAKESNGAVKRIKGKLFLAPQARGAPIPGSRLARFCKLGSATCASCAGVDIRAAKRSTLIQRRRREMS
jgi:hypothetical protein